MDATVLDLLKGGGVAGVIIIAFWLLILPIIKTSTAEVSASRQERQSVLLPMVENMTRLTLSIQESQRQNQESHTGLMQTIIGLKSAVDILCEKANGGK
jgi:ABC-type bacteriocin/lantibiotic exporter with double-glycine peptidase domain